MTTRKESLLSTITRLGIFTERSHTRKKPLSATLVSQQLVVYHSLMDNNFHLRVSMNSRVGAEIELPLYVCLAVYRQNH
jgi:hypothetical protein